MTQNWHWRFLESFEKRFLNQPLLKEKYELRNSNRERLYLPYKSGMIRNEILSNPDIVFVNKKNGNFDYIFEVEYQVNHKKIVGIALLTDIAIRQMKVEGKSKLILITKEEFPNSELVEREIQRYVKNIEFSLYSSDNFASTFDSLIK